MNPAHHPAISGGMCLDARFIRGVANNAAVQTWSSRPGANHAFTQVTLARRPRFSERGLGGQAVVNFTATSQQWMSRSGITVGSTTDPYTIFAVSAANGNRRYTQTSNTSFLGAGSASYTLATGITSIAITNTDSATLFLPTVTPETGVMALGRSGTTLYGLSSPNGSMTTLVAPNLNLSTTRNSSTPNNFLNASIGALCIATEGVSDSMRNRIMHHYGYSFKLAL